MTASEEPAEDGSVSSTMRYALPSARADLWRSTISCRSSASPLSLLKRSSCGHSPGRLTWSIASADSIFRSPPTCEKGSSLRRMPMTICASAPKRAASTARRPARKDPNASVAVPARADSSATRRVRILGSLCKSTPDAVTRARLVPSSGRGHCGSRGTRSNTKRNFENPASIAANIPSSRICASSKYGCRRRCSSGVSAPSRFCRTTCSQSSRTASSAGEKCREVGAAMWSICCCEYPAASVSISLPRLQTWHPWCRESLRRTSSFMRWSTFMSPSLL